MKFYILAILFCLCSNLSYAQKTKKSSKTKPTTAKKTVVESKVAEPPRMEGIREEVNSLEIAGEAKQEGLAYNDTYKRDVYPKNASRRPFGNGGKYYLESIEVSKYKELYGITDVKGKVVLPTFYNSIDLDEKNENYVYVKLGNQTALYTNDFKQLFPFEYTQIIPKSNYFLVSNDSEYDFKLVDKNNENVLDDQYLVNVFNTNNNYIEQESQNLLRIKNKKTYNYGVYDFEKKQIVMPIEYEELYKSGNNFVAKKRGELYNVLDQNFQPIFNKGFTYVSVVANSLFQISDNGKSGIANEKGEWIIPCTNLSIQYITQPINGFVVNTNAVSANLYDLKGKVIFSNEIQQLYTSDNSSFVAKKNGKWGLINILQQELLPFKYDTIFSNYSVLYAIADKKTVSYNSTNGNLNTLPYEVIEKINYDYYKVKANNKFGLLSSSLKVLIPIEFDDIKFVYYNETYINVTKAGKQGLYKTNGNVVIAAEYDKIYKIGYINGLIVKKDNKYGIVSGNSLIEPCIYDAIAADYDNEYSFICIKGNTIKSVRVDSKY
jgi:hypothetical protein